MRTEALGLRQEPAAGSLATTLILSVILATGPVVLGAARPWILFPMLLLLWGLVLMQGFRAFLATAPEGQRAIDALDILVTAFLGYASWRLFHGPFDFGGRLEVLSIGAYAATFWICRYGITRREHGIFLLAMLLLVGLGVTIFAFLLDANPHWRPYGEELHLHYVGRLIGSYGCPNHFGSLAAMTAGIALSIGFFSRYPWVVRILCVYAALVLIAGVVLSASRGSWLALAAAFVFLAIFAVRHANLRWYWPVGFLVLALLGGTAAVISSQTAYARVQEALTILAGDHLQGYVRVELSRDALLIFKDHPWIGTGPATFTHVHPRYQSPTYTTLAIHTHNDYLNLLSDYGIVGFAICMLFLYGVTRRVFVYLGARPDPRDRTLLAAGGAAWAALLVHSTVDFNLHIPANALILFTLTGLAVRVADGTRPPAAMLPASRAAKPVAWLAWIFSGLLLIVTVKVARAYYAFFLAEKAYGTEVNTALLQRALFAAEADPYASQNLRLVGSLYRLEASQETDFAERVPLAQEAADWYQRAHQVNPEDDSLYVYRGLAHDLMGRFPEAYLMYSTAVARQPYNGYFKYMLGMHFWRRGLTEQARETFLAGTKDPHGREENQAALAELNKIIEQAKKAAEGPEVDTWESPYRPAPNPEETVP